MTPLAYVAAAAALSVSAVLTLPLVAAFRFRSAREPTPEEHERLAELCERAGLSVPRRHVVDTRGANAVEVSVRGPPGYRHLFVSDVVLEELDGETAAALLAAEAGRVGQFYGEYRALSVGVAMGLAASGFALVLPFEVAMSALVAAALAFTWGGRRLQYRADDRAAGRVGADALADAFERVADRHGVEPESDGWSTVFEMQPPLGARIGRLRRRTG